MDNLSMEKIMASRHPLAGKYTEEVDDYADLMTVEQFRRLCQSGAFIDYDGFGHAVKDGKMDGFHIYPSRLASIPSDATHINWYNR